MHLGLRFLDLSIAVHQTLSWINILAVVVIVTVIVIAVIAVIAVVVQLGGAANGDAIALISGPSGLAKCGHADMRTCGSIVAFN